jgi:hypothetical protein
VLLSQISPELVTRLLMTPAQSMDEAVAKGIALAGAEAGQALRVAVLPHATNTIPA